MAEKLRVKMWESLDRFIAGALKPYQQQRLAKGELEIKQLNAICDSEINKYVKGAHESTLRFINGKESINIHRERVEPYLTELGIDSSYIEVQLNQIVESQHNLISAVHIADRILSETHESDANGISIDHDWVYRWQKYASDVSDKDMQFLWANILATEVVQPGRNSLRTIEFLRTLSKDEAGLISKLGSHAFSGFILDFSEKLLAADNIDFGKLMHLESIGVITARSFDEIGIEFDNEGTSDKFQKSIAFNDVTLFVEHHDPHKTIKFRTIPFTTTGRHLLSLARVNANQFSLDEFTKRLEQDGFTIRVQRAEVTIEAQKQEQ